MENLNAENICFVFVEKHSTDHEENKKSDAVNELFEATVKEKKMEEDELQQVVVELPPYFSILMILGNIIPGIWSLRIKIGRSFALFVKKVFDINTPLKIISTLIQEQGHMYAITVRQALVNW